MKKISPLFFVLFCLSLGADSAYQKGLKAYQSEEYYRALKYFYISARHHNTPAYIKLGVMHEQGQGTDVNLPTAFYWYEKAAKQNDRQAQYHLSEFYTYGKWVQKDQAKANYYRQLSGTEQNETQPIASEEDSDSQPDSSFKEKFSSIFSGIGF